MLGSSAVSISGNRLSRRRRSSSAAAAASTKGTIAAGSAVAGSASTPAVLAAAVAKAGVVAGEAVGSSAGSVSRDLSAGRRVGGVGRGVSTSATSAVPGRFSLSHALAHSYHPIAGLANALEHVGGQVVGSQLMNVMGNCKEIIIRWVLAIESVVNVVLGVLDLLTGKLIVIISVQVEVRNDIAEGAHIGLATRSSSTRRVGGTHIGREFSNDVGDGHFVLDHLITALSASDSTEILMRPGVAGNLMTFRDHATEHTGPWLASIINGALANVDTSHEESSLCVIRFEQVHNVVGVRIGAVIIGDSNGSWNTARIHALTTIGNATKLSPRDTTGASSSGGLVGITPRAELELAVGGRAEITTLTAVSCRGTAVSSSAASTSTSRTTAPILTSLASLQLRALLGLDIPGFMTAESVPDL